MPVSQNVFAFDPQDPFPLLSLDDAEKLSAKDHAKSVDAWLGFKIEEVENDVRARRFGDELKNFETWSHISAQVFLTSYLELRYWMQKLDPRPGSTLVDLGAGYGRLAFVLEKHFAQVAFVGIECVAARVAEAQRVMRLQNLQRSQMIVGDLNADEFIIPAAELYFVYDCGSQEMVDGVIERLAVRAPAASRLLTRGLRACQAARASQAWRAESATDIPLNSQVFVRRHS